MNEQIREFWKQAVLNNTKTPMNFQNAADEFAEMIIGHATECVRDVLREEDSPLTYEAASMVQKRIKEFFGVK